MGSLAGSRHRKTRWCLCSVQLLYLELALHNKHLFTSPSPVRLLYVEIAAAILPILSLPPTATSQLLYTDELSCKKKQASTSPHMP
ncbi:hypothetical protein THAOC_12888 [Thalassiosira oceanica]|uniref:Uncharacterized protein n=1 Tax=Thalassiosira oceanica TaxID=159749 RepID=K0SYZ7_THAOC|nr:hypothetical protein THAOC_12888 [Thalassiosira oceanica]|eukprot:EJK66206.1 hypothetical protein THAOC_12888 [Thalassiosira oceanica]